MHSVGVLEVGGHRTGGMLVGGLEPREVVRALVAALGFCVHHNAVA